MRKAIVLLGLLLFASAAVAQTQPQWKVIQSVTLTKQTAEIPVTTLFTPTAEGFYRVSAYISAGGPTGGNWTLYFQWTDIMGGVPLYGAQVYFDDGSNFDSAMFTFVEKPGTPFTYYTNGTAGSYNIAFTVEQLK
jgi:hypothetical protein